jgi:hypothetical protein
MNRNVTSLICAVIFLFGGIVGEAFGHLHPVIGRFTQRDPLGYVDGLSVYQYLQSTPIGRLDPFGYGGFTNSCTSPIWVFCGDGDPPWKLVQQGETRECGDALFDPLTEPGRPIYKWVDCFKVKCEGAAYHTTGDPGGGDTWQRRCCCAYPPCALASQAARGGWGNAGDPHYPPTPPPGCHPIPGGWHCEYPGG